MKIIEGDSGKFFDPNIFSFFMNIEDSIGSVQKEGL